MATTPKAAEAEDNSTEADHRRAAAAVERRVNATAKLLLPALVLGGAVFGGFTVGVQGVVLAFASGALLAVIWVLWASLRTFLGETPLEGADAYALGAPRAEEEQKRAVLRTLKDLEAERSVGKISEDDYQMLVAKYRAEAKRLLRRLDEEAAPRRERIEHLVAKRLRDEGIAASEASRKEREKAAKAAAKVDVDEDEDEKLAAAEKAKTASPRPILDDDELDDDELDDDERDDGLDDDEAEERPKSCEKCGTENDADAVFCKKCGARQLPEEAS